MLCIGQSEIPGHTSDVTPEEVHVRLSCFPGELPASGTEADLRLLLPDHGEPLVTPAQILWVHPEEGSPTGAAGLGIGLRLTDASASARLVSFVRDYRYTVLAVDGEPADLEAIRQALQSDYRVLTCATAAEALSLLQTHDVSAVIASDRGTDMPCVELLQRCAELSAGGHMALIVSHFRELAEQLQAFIELGGIFGYVSKPFRASELRQVVRRGVDACALALENDRLNAELERANHRLQRENVFLRRRLQVSQGFEHVIGQSPELRRVFAELECVRQTNTTVHVQGETGTGKELVARALHFGGVRAGGPFVAQNCAGMSESLLQSTLFGHKKGAFTGAVRDYSGVFEQAHGGTLFLDEVAELSPSTQAALLRALQEGEIIPLGAAQPVKVDVRIVSATHEDLRELVKQGRFREDLYFRLMVLPVRLPPLREREGDVPLLARHFLSLHCQHHGKTVGDFTPDAMRALERYPWPGNVRELENEIERVVVLIDDGRPIGRELLSPQIRRYAEGPPASGDEELRIPHGLGYDESIQLLERALVERALQRARGSVSAAAQLLGMERSRLGKLRTRLGLTGSSRSSGGEA